ncbi:MAG: hypothetical protein LBH10_03765 [Burkholderiaceae bacterium]|nr:hypothetical protein [Burkholderiaceae bacterium]
MLIDAEFFIKRATRIYGRQTPTDAADTLHQLALEHLNENKRRRIARLYRIFVYDAPPVLWRGHTPLGEQVVDLAATPTAQWWLAFHQALREKRKVALRMGKAPTN